MKVSVIIPVHRGEAFLRDCLGSFVQESCKDLELLVIQDHVTDFSVEEVCQEMEDDLNIRVYSLKETTGVAEARNLGLYYAQGEYVYFLDSDDYLYQDTIAQLVKTATEQKADVVYGRKVSSWFKRSVFLESFQKELEEEEERDAEMTGLIRGELDEEKNFPGPQKCWRPDQILAQRMLLSRKHGIKNVSVLGILIRKSLLQEKEIHFPREFTYYSDLPFVCELLEAKGTFAYCDDSIYIKRKHNDPDHFPALCQQKDENRFTEYLDAYDYTCRKIQEDSDIRLRLDRKMISYYCGYYMTRMRRSEREEWCQERFVQMRHLAEGFHEKALMGQDGYKKKAIRLLLAGNVKGSIHLINRRLGMKKLRDFLKNKNEIYKYFYRHFFLKQPLLKDTVLLESFFAKSYSDSPKYIYEYLQKNYPGKYKFVWVINEKTQIPFPHKEVRRFSMGYAYYLARAKYCIFNVRQPMWVQKREGNIFLETWHGTPLKKLVFDQDEVCGASPLYKHQFFVQSRVWDYLVAANQFSSDVFRSCFCYDKEMLEFGYPRNDILHGEDREERAKEIRKKLHIPSDKKTILYAPTWRDDEYYDKGSYKFALKLDLGKLKEALGDEYVLLLRTHYFIADSLDVTGLEDFAYNLSKYDDISELYLISDLLITDYSSVFFDYANLRRPILFYTYDLEKYRDVLRGFYISIEEEVPGPLLFTQDEVVEAVKNIDTIREEYKEKYDIFYDRFCSWEDGHAAEHCAKKVFGLEETK